MRSAIISLTIFLLLSVPAGYSQPAAGAGLLQKLLDLPAPAPFDPPKETPPPRVRAQNFQDDDNIPPDDAPIEDLLDYWSRSYNSLYTARYVPTASKKTIERILEYCKENPRATSNYLSIFPSTPETIDAVKSIFDKAEANPPSGYGNSYQLQEWLKFNSRLYIDDLLGEANSINDRDNYTSSQNQYVLRALATIDWDAALPIVRRLENDQANPASAVLARWVIYRHALDTGDDSAADSYREQLKEVVADKKAGWAIRDLAMDALTHSPGWDGRDEWYLSLLEDETLLTIQDNHYTGLTTMLMESPRKQWLGRMIELAESKNVTVRTAAARNLMRMVRAGDANALRALIPWLSDAAWAKESGSGERRDLVFALTQTLLPEAVPGLIRVVLNEEDLRQPAAVALAYQKDPRAIPALRTVLANAMTREDRINLIGSLLTIGGFSDDEQMAALEAYILLVSTEDGARQMADYTGYDGYRESGDDDDDDDETPAPALSLEISIGLEIGEQREPSEGLVARAIERLNSWKKTNPPAAANLAELMLRWKGAGIYTEQLRLIRAGEIDIDSLIIALANRKEIREAIPAAVSSLVNAPGAAGGIGACLAEDGREYSGILEQKDVEAQTALLGCARMIRARLPVEEAGKLLQSPDKLLSMAAERYLESEDSLDARKLVLAKNPGKAMILGARSAFMPEAKPSYNPEALAVLFESAGAPLFRPGDFPKLRTIEDSLRKEVIEDQSLINVFGILDYGAGGQRGAVRLYKDRATFRYYENGARYWERDLTRKEYEGLRDFLVRENIDLQKPVRGGCDEGCFPSEFVMFGRDGGRRVFFENTNRNPAIVKLLDTFRGFSSDDLKLHYLLADKAPGLRVLYADQSLPIRAVWKKAGDFRIVVEDKARAEEIQKDLGAEALEKEKTEKSAGDQSWIRSYRQRLIEAKYGHFSWRTYENGRPGSFAAQPPEAPFLYDSGQVKEMEGISATPRGWQARSGNSEIRSGEFSGDLFRISPGEEPVVLKTGYYRTPIVSADGKWAIASKLDENKRTFTDILRINLQTGREYKFDVKSTVQISPVAFVYSHNQALVRSGPRESSEAADETETADNYVPRYLRGRAKEITPAPEYYLANPATGAVQRVKGEFRPLEHQTYRPLQPTGNPGEFWAAIYDKKGKTTGIGRYNDKTFTFRPALTLPDMELNSMDIWVDEPGGKVYFVYDGHLLSLPMTKPVVSGR